MPAGRFLHKHLSVCFAHPPASRAPAVSESASALFQVGVERALSHLGSPQGHPVGLRASGHYLQTLQGASVQEVSRSAPTSLWAAWPDAVGLSQTGVHPAGHRASAWVSQPRVPSCVHPQTVLGTDGTPPPSPLGLPCPGTRVNGDGGCGPCGWGAAGGFGVPGGGASQARPAEASTCPPPRTQQQRRGLGPAAPACGRRALAPEAHHQPVQVRAAAAAHQQAHHLHGGAAALVQRARRPVQGGLRHR